MGEQQTFADFVRDRGPFLYRFGYLLTGNHHDAEDLVQEALLRVRRHWTRVTRAGDPIGYVRTTMSRLHISAWRRRRESPTAQLPDTPVLDAALDTADRAAAKRAVWETLAVLPPRQRAVIVLRFYEQLTDDEIADTLRVSRGTVRSQASRGLDKLRAAGINELMEAVR